MIAGYEEDKEADDVKEMGDDEDEETDALKGDQDTVGNIEFGSNQSQSGSPIFDVCMESGQS